MLATELFYLTLLHSFIGYYFEYLPLSPLQVCGVPLTSFKKFKAFWECYFTYLVVKGIDNFWNFWGLVDGFKELCRQIASGVVKTADESMSAIRFRTTPIGNLPHYSYIFWKPKPLGKEIKNVDCSRLETLLHLYI